MDCSLLSFQDSKRHIDYSWHTVCFKLIPYHHPCPAGKHKFEHDRQVVLHYPLWGSGGRDFVNSKHKVANWIRIPNWNPKLRKMLSTITKNLENRTKRWMTKKQPLKKRSEQDWRRKRSARWNHWIATPSFWHILRHLHEFNKALLRMLTFCRTWCHRDSKYNIAAGVIVFHGFYTRV